MAWAMRKSGLETARIADRLGKSVDEIEVHISDFERARAEVSTEIVNMVVNAEVLTAMSGVGNRLQMAMAAERFTGATDRAGNPIFEPDHTTALEAMRVTKEFAEVSQPKGGGAAINIGIQNNPGGGNGNGSGTVKTFEQRVREKRGVLPEGDVKFLSDGKGNEVIEGDLIDDDDDDDIDDEIIDDMADGTSDLEIEEAESSEVRD